MSEVYEVANDRSVTEPLEGIYDVLSNSRRRWTIRYVAESLGEGRRTISLRDLADALAEAEHGTDPHRRERKTAYVNLHQIHLPKLHDVGIVRYDEDRKDVRQGPYLDCALDGMETFEFSFDSCKEGDLE